MVQQSIMRARKREGKKHKYCEKIEHKSPVEYRRYERAIPVLTEKSREGRMQKSSIEE